MNDLILQGLKNVALRGKGEYGPHFDRGLLSVIDEIERTGSYVPNHLAQYLWDKSKPDGGMLVIYAAREKAVLESERLARGLATTEATQFAHGVCYAQMSLKDYSTGIGTGWINPKDPGRGLAANLDLPWHG